MASSIQDTISRDRAAQLSYLDGIKHEIDQEAWVIQAEKRGRKEADLATARRALQKGHSVDDIIEIIDLQGCEVEALAVELKKNP